MSDTAATEDAAWATINTPLDADSLKSFCRDIERLFRINPMLIFYKWETLGDNHYLFSGKNISQEQPFDFDLELDVRELPDGFQVDYGQGLKTSTTFKIEAAPADSQWSSRLTITDCYDGHTKEERQALLHTVDKSIVVWAEYLQRYLLSWQRWSRFGPWRWYMHKVWQPMKPSGRRVTYMLLWITFFEIALIAFGFLIYYLEYT